MNIPLQRVFIFALLALLIVSTRFNHFAAIPDASWAVFFIGGFYLRSWARWAFPAFMGLAVLVDWLVTQQQGISFWQHYCISAAYWLLIPAYLLLWLGGVWLNQRYSTANWHALGLLLGAGVVAVAGCQLLAQGSFYWMSSSVANPSLAGWWQNYVTYLFAYLQTAGLYIGAAALMQVLAERFGFMLDTAKVTNTNSL